MLSTPELYFSGQPSVCCNCCRLRPALYTWSMLIVIKRVLYIRHLVYVVCSHASLSTLIYHKNGAFVNAVEIGGI